MDNWEYSKTWYHGSPFELDELAEGSTITQDRHLAEIFSHKPPIVCVDDTGNRYHNGKQNGFLYVIDEVITSEDVYPHPKTTMAPGDEWLITKPLKVKKIANTHPKIEELLSAEEEEELIKRLNGK